MPVTHVVEDPVAGYCGRGRQVVAAKACSVCQSFSGTDAVAALEAVGDFGLDAKALARAVQLAPDLRHTRQRMRPAEDEVRRAYGSSEVSD